MPVITQEFIAKGATSKGCGWTRAQLEVLGANWPLVEGWRARLIGRVITEEAAKRFLELSNANLGKRQHKDQGDLFAKEDAT